MANRTVKSQSKKAMSTKYSAIGSTVVPLSQQMRNTKSPSTSTKNQSTPTDNFFDDIMADWDQPDNNTKNKNVGIGIHNKNNDVYSSSSSLAFTPTPPPKPNPSTDRNIYILTDTKDDNQIPENKSNYTQSIFDDILTTTNTNTIAPIPTQNGTNKASNKIIEKPLSETKIHIDDTVRNDPNYLPPPEDIELSSSSNSSSNNTAGASKIGNKSDNINPSKKQKRKKKDTDTDTIPPSPGRSELNPWAHLNKTMNTNIMEAPIEDIDEEDDNEHYEDRGFLKHEADDHNDIDTPYANGINKRNNKNGYINIGNIQMSKCCYCIIFIIGIIIGVLLTIALIKHQAIDANYLFGPTAVESENDNVIQEEINVFYNNSKHINEYHSYDSNIESNEKNDIFKHIRATKITSQPSKFNVWNGFGNRTWKHKTRVPTNKPTNKPIMVLTESPTTTTTTTTTTNKPSVNPTRTPTTTTTTTTTTTGNPSMSPSESRTVIKTETVSDSPTHSPVVNERVMSESPTHSPILNEVMTKTDHDVGTNTIITNDENMENVVVTDINDKLENDTNKEDNGLIQLSKLNDNDDENVSDIDDNEKKTTPSPTDYHHIHEGIEIANKMNEELSKFNNDSNTKNQTNINIDNSPSRFTQLSINAKSNDDTQQKEDNNNSNDVLDSLVSKEENVNMTKNSPNPTHHPTYHPTHHPTLNPSPLPTSNQHQQINNATSNPSRKNITIESVDKSPDQADRQTQSIYSQSDSGEDDESILPNVSPLCNVNPNPQCNINSNNRAPLPFDKPLSAQLNCHQNTCRSPPSLPGQRIISGETYEAGKTILDVQHEIAIKCHTQHLHTIKVERNGYDDNEDWKYCIRISNDDSLKKFPILHVTFSLISFDIEQGFDNLFMTTQFNDIYDDYCESWTGQWSTLHKFEPNTWYQNFWMTSSEPNSFAEFCLRLQSDESNTGKGFIAKFSITREIGIWSEWSLCTAHSNSENIANSACGIGVRSRVSLCPNYIVENTKKKADNEDGRFEWSNGTHSCIHKFSNYPLRKYCIVANCNDIDNEKYAPINIVKRSKQQGTWDDVGSYIYNGRTRIDPQYADPFNIIMNTNRYEINLDELKTNLQSEIDNILSRYPVASQNIFPETFSMTPIHFSKLGVRLLSSLLLGRVFTYVATGSSNTAGHDNVFMSAYPMQLNSLMQVIWNKYSIYGGAFRVRDQAIGGHLGTAKQGPCISALIGTYDKNIDMVSWESFMNDATHVWPGSEEIWLRNILLTYNKEHSQPFLTCISTSESRQAACRIDGGRYIFNSFLGYYANATGVSNFFGEYVCNADKVCNNSKLLDENGEDIECKNRAGNEACRACCASWHPSPHRHRVLAETFGVALIQSVLNAIDRLSHLINNGYPSYELVCLLEDYKGEIYDEYGILSSVDRNHAVFERPLTKPIKCGSECENRMWCATSFWPAPKHNQLHRYFINVNGFYNNDTIDLPVHPLIMRNGGRAPIDHKAQWLADDVKIGAFLELKVKVPTRYIMIVYPQGTSRWNLAQYFHSIQFLVDGEEKYCQGTSYDETMESFCLLDCQKPGKYTLKITIVNDTNPFGDPKKYAIDEIAGI